MARAYRTAVDPAAPPRSQRAWLDSTNKKNPRMRGFATTLVPGEDPSNRLQPLVLLGFRAFNSSATH